MTYWVAILLGGLLCLIFGANWLVSGSSGLAKKYGVSEIIIGLTIVAMGTSTPELVVNISGSVSHQSDIVLGNVIGSNIFNLFFILGISALILPISVKSSTAWKEIPFSLICSILLLVIFKIKLIYGDGNFGFWEGIVFIVIFMCFLYYLLKHAKSEKNSAEITQNRMSYTFWIQIIVGLTALIIGAEFVVKNSIRIAQHLEVSEKIISLTIVAAGTSLPELITSVVAAIKGKNDIAIGNVIGSNIFNLLVILGVSGIIHPIKYDIKYDFDQYILIAGTMLLLLAMIIGKRKKLDRWEGAILLLLYLAYTTFLIYKE